MSGCKHVALASIGLALAACGVGNFAFDGRGPVDGNTQADASDHPGDAPITVDVADALDARDAAADIVVSDIAMSDAVDTTNVTDVTDVALDTPADADCAANCAGGSCATGLCVCPSGTAHCGRDCVNLQTDFLNCGTCTNSCTPHVCTAGTCGCPGTQMFCSGSCVDLTTSTSNCGACGAACAGGHVCRSSSCQCPSGQIPCSDGTCSACPPTTGGTPACTAMVCGVACSTGYAPHTATDCCLFATQAFDSVGGANTLSLASGSYTIGGAFNDTGGVSIGPNGTGTFTLSGGCSFNVSLSFSGPNCDPSVIMTIVVTSNPSSCSNTSRFAGMWREM